MTGYWHYNVAHLAICRWCCVLWQKCGNKWLGSPPHPPAHAWFYNFQLPTLILIAQKLRRVMIVIKSRLLFETVNKKVQSAISQQVLGYLLWFGGVIVGILDSRSRDRM